MNQIAPAFIKAKKAFGPALKDKNNPHFKSKYADLGTCLEAVDDALLANGIAVYQETFEDATGVTVETVFLHESGEMIRTGKLHVPASKQDPQGYGSALTYARRYSLMTACGIAPEDDDGNSASQPRPAPQPVAKPGLTASDIDSVKLAMHECADLDQLKEMFAAAYKKANGVQQADLKAAYDKQKDYLTTRKAA
ncbi:MAG TPA: ERF family protein [Noviherbaspirillum sp.]|jgi:hypothetical protein|uniref:ERF family protein n=1 Tax=Noviherbaspirillum sp. TaxID=1926288 RepID=UPI002DDC985C|nr:ERF family protein [Noviherbaspirillum sp.]HEV2612506.1 ERF family protein [Noviherbaspirillum sp.]